ncbi:MAG TPA: hypothetical protein VEA38_08410 [Terriglobales bacterium]|nr:hypothetical protein [Terriglobales bacterium]
MRRGKAPRLPAAALFDAQALSVAEYVMAREGARYFGELARRVRAGEPVDSVLAGARSLPRSVAGLDDSWRAWVADVGGGPGGRPGISRAPRGR